jgi:dTMP kinase
MDVRTFDFPHYESVAGACIGRRLRGETGFLRVIPDKMDVGHLDKAIVIQSVMIADRLEHLDLLNGFAYSSNRLLILDRYLLSGIVYGQADGLPRSWIVKVQQALPKAALTFFVDIPVAESVRRKPERADLYEKDLPKLEKVRKLYLEEMERSSSIVCVDGHRSVKEVNDDLFALARKLFV